MKKTTKVVLGVVLAVAALGTVAWLVVQHRFNDEVAIEVKPVALAELPDGKLDLTDEATSGLVNELYKQFEVLPLQVFYEDELSSVEGMSTAAERGRLEMALNRAEDWTGATVREKYRELFGGEIELTEEKYGIAQDVLIAVEGMKFVVYSEEQDEFQMGPGPSIAVARRHVRRLERAEKEEDKIYLYERAMALRCQPDFGAEGNRADREPSCGVLTVAASCGTPEFGWSNGEDKMADEEVLGEAAKMKIGMVRWVFERAADGRYIYRGMNRVIEN